MVGRSMLVSCDDTSARDVPMQASKVTMRMPTLLPFGEGSNERGKQSTRAPARSAGVVGTARRKGGSGNRGRPVIGEGSVLNVATGGGHGGSRTGSYERRSWVVLAEQRALTFGMLSKMVR